MPRKQTIQRAKADLRAGKRPTTAAGEFVREEIEHVREGKHGARSTKQAIAIGLSKARRAGVPLKPPAKGRASSRTRRSAERELEIGQGKRKPRSPSARRRRATTTALRKEPRSTVSRSALSRQAKSAARRRRRSAPGRKAQHAKRRG
jgi:hypothetical protein